ncbi:hypothetical protein [Corynebacterium mayonis]|uniref:hypothetical protein n=1 Tax=Corynebacterium mayonis TaxID=3062461 RepID=UPI003140139B
MTFFRTSIAVVGALSVSVLSACGSSQEDSSPETQTVTETSQSSSTPEQGARIAPDAQAVPITAGTAGVGETVAVNGGTAEVCVYGDGFGLNTIAAGPNTSCEFAEAALDALTEGLNATSDNVRNLLPSAVRVHSPVTGEDYDLECVVDREQIVSCWGANDASVFMY